MCGAGTLVHDSAAAAILKPCPCGKWDCDLFREAMLRRLQAIARRGNPTKFLTLTVNPAWGSSPEWRRKKLLEKFAVLKQRWKRFVGGEFEYFWWCEEQPSTGEPHIHVFLRAYYLHWTKLKAWWEELAGGSRPNIQAIYNPKQMFRYIKSYLKDGPVKYGNCRRWGKSKNYAPKLEDDDRQEYEKQSFVYDRMSTNDVELGYQARGFVSIIRQPWPGKRVLVWPAWELGCHLPMRPQERVSYYGPKSFNPERA